MYVGILSHFLDASLNEQDRFSVRLIFQYFQALQKDSETGGATTEEKKKDDGPEDMALD